MGQRPPGRHGQVRLPRPQMIDPGTSLHIWPWVSLFQVQEHQSQHKKVMSRTRVPRMQASAVRNLDEGPLEKPEGTACLSCSRQYSWKMTRRKEICDNVFVHLYSVKPLLTALGTNNWTKYVFVLTSKEIHQPSCFFIN